MGYLYINMDRKLIKNGGRNAERISKEDFLKKIAYVHQKNEDYIEESTSAECLEVDFTNFKEEDIVYYVMAEIPKVYSDISKVNFDDENNYTSSNDTPVIDDTIPNLLGIHTLSNGLTFLGCMAGGDWEYPLFHIIYWDGKSFRGYIPSYGNCYNIHFKSAFGSEDDNLDATINEIIRKKNYSTSDLINSRLSEAYMERQGIKIHESSDSLVVNWNAVKEDIENRITVFGASLERSNNYNVVVK